MRQSWRVLLRPAWVTGHVLVLVAAVAFALLGRWQWDNARGSGSLQNYSYAVEWWLFAAFAVIGWGWYCKDELVVRPEPEVAEPPPPPPVVDDPEDPELAAYNRYLRELHQRSTG